MLADRATILSLLVSSAGCIFFRPAAVVEEEARSILSSPPQIAIAVDNPPFSNENDQNPHTTVSQYRSTNQTSNELLEHAVHALDVLQARFYELWLGIYPEAIDWTAAVTNTHVSAILNSLARFNSNTGSGNGTGTAGTIRSSEVIHRYFSHNIAYYFGENAFAIRNEAYDDMLWVVLGWLESVKFINARNATDAEWHGTQFIPAFSHRARIFWDIAAKGWDTSLCGGGMIWNPRLTPYKNAITNQLFISASVAMYLYFPGDTNPFPYLMQDGVNDGDDGEMGSEGRKPGYAFDAKYLDAAIDGYAWLKKSSMKNAQGLYIDGFHIHNWGVGGKNGTGKCDERNEQVYTYNQGVILSGLRGLWEATGDSTYLADGYELVRSVMTATGWSEGGKPHHDRWSGLGQNGVLEEMCDRQGACSQDAQTFKGIFFQHLTQFCMPLPLKAIVPGKTQSASRSLAALHESNCLVIGAWVTHNAEAALAARDRHGIFGMWWGARSSDGRDNAMAPLSGAQDYRNNASILSSETWAGPGLDPRENLQQPHSQREVVDSRSMQHIHRLDAAARASKNKKEMSTEDLNDRGRGRTVETQGGGLSVVRAAWEMMPSRRISK